MEKMHWFKFSISEWKMGKIQRCTPEAKSAFIELCCLYWINETKLSIEDAIIECDEINYQNLVAKKVIKEIDGFIKIYFLDEQFENVLEKSDKARESVKKRWEKRNTNVNESNTNVLESNYDSNTEEKRKEKKRLEIYIPEFSEFLSYAVELKPNINNQELKLKYEAWKVNGWKDGNDKPIKNWKSKLAQTLKYISTIEPKQPNTPTIVPHWNLNVDENGYLKEDNDN